MSDNYPLRCARLDKHDAHNWSRPRDLMAPRHTWHCNGFVITTLAEQQWADSADFDEAQDDEFREWMKGAWAS